MDTMDNLTNIHARDYFEHIDGHATVITNPIYGLTEEKLMEELGVTRSALRNFFKILEQERVPFDDLDKKLREIAGQYTELLQRLEFVQSEDPKVVAFKTQARQAIEAGQFAASENLLKQAETRDLDAIEQLEAAAKQRRLSAAETNADNARLQRIQLRYARAAEYFQKAANVLPESEQRKRALYLNEAGYDFHRIARYADALPLYEKSLAIDRAIGDKAGEGATLNNLGQIFQAAIPVNSSSQGRSSFGVFLDRFQPLRLRTKGINRVPEQRKLGVCRLPAHCAASVSGMGLGFRRLSGHVITPLFVFTVGGRGVDTALGGTARPGPIPGGW